jgi:PTS system mannose-specific IIB component/fructoselysine and glucoselysine-specific PTS system IIB component
MSLVLARIDDRLIHGQVVIGWGRPLGVTLIVLVDDQVAASPWEQELYRMAVPPEIRVEFAGVADAAAHLAGWAAAADRVLVLTGDIPTMVALHDARADLLHHINLGGIHHRPGRIERLRYLYLTEGELRALKALASSGATVTAQDLPTAAPVPLESLG